MCAAVALAKPLGPLVATKQKDRDVCLAYGVHHVAGLVPHTTSVLWTGRMSSSVRHPELTTTSFGLSPLGQPLAMTSTASVFASEMAGTSPSASSHPAKYRLPALSQPPPEPVEALYSESPQSQLTSSFTAQDLRQLLQIGKSDGFEMKRERSKADSPTCKNIGVALQAGKRVKESDRQAPAQSRSLPSLLQEPSGPSQMIDASPSQTVSPTATSQRGNDVSLPPVQDDTRNRTRGTIIQGGGKEEADKVVSPGRAKGMSILEGNSTARGRAYHQALALTASNLKRRPKAKDNNEIMDVHEARERQKRHQWLVNDAEYLDSRIAYLRRGKVHTKWHMRVFNNDQLWENKTLYTTYSVGLRKKKRAKKGDPEVAPPLEPPPVEPTRKRESILQQQQPAGKKKSDIPPDHSKQLSSLTKDLKVSTRSLEVAIDPEKENEEESEEKVAAAQQASFLAELQASFRRKIGPGNDAQAHSPEISPPASAQTLTAAVRRRSSIGSFLKAPAADLQPGKQ
mmetsp:Transcript_42550/g.77264  ORF Transcript_42550/g.77264 Transcript_42550/m.77264 type:complete len:512 (-) Transcript_42550:51-1586(-)